MGSCMGKNAATELQGSFTDIEQKELQSCGGTKNPFDNATKGTTKSSGSNTSPAKGTQDGYNYSTQVDPTIDATAEASTDDDGVHDQSTTSNENIGKDSSGSTLPDRMTNTKNDEKDLATGVENPINSSSMGNDAEIPADKPIQTGKNGKINVDAAIKSHLASNKSLLPVLGDEESPKKKEGTDLLPIRSPAKKTPEQIHEEKMAALCSSKLCGGKYGGALWFLCHIPEVVPPENTLGLLNLLDNLPQKSESDLRKLPIANGKSLGDLPNWSLKEVSEKSRGKEMYFICNRKVLQYRPAGAPERLETDLLLILKKHVSGKDITVQVAKNRCHPKYSVPHSIEHMNAELKSIVEDILACSILTKSFKCVAVVIEESVI